MDDPTYLPYLDDSMVRLVDKTGDPEYYLEAKTDRYRDKQAELNDALERNAFGGYTRPGLPFKPGKLKKKAIKYATKYTGAAPSKKKLGRILAALGSPKHLAKAKADTGARTGVNTGARTGVNTGARTGVKPLSAPYMRVVAKLRKKLLKKIARKAPSAARAARSMLQGDAPDAALAIAADRGRNAAKTGRKARARTAIAKAKRKAAKRGLVLTQEEITAIKRKAKRKAKATTAEPYIKRAPKTETETAEEINRILTRHPVTVEDDPDATYEDQFDQSVLDARDRLVASGHEMTAADRAVMVSDPDRFIETIDRALSSESPMKTHKRVTSESIDKAQAERKLERSMSTDSIFLKELKSAVKNIHLKPIPSEHVPAAELDAQFSPDPGLAGAPSSSAQTAMSSSEGEFGEGQTGGDGLYARGLGGRALMLRPAGGAVGGFVGAATLIAAAAPFVLKGIQWIAKKIQARRAAKATGQGIANKIAHVAMKLMTRRQKTGVRSLVNTGARTSVNTGARTSVKGRSIYTLGAKIAKKVLPHVYEDRKAIRPIAHKFINRMLAKLHGGDRKHPLIAATSDPLRPNRADLIAPMLSGQGLVAMRPAIKRWLEDPLMLKAAKRIKGGSIAESIINIIKDPKVQAIAKDVFKEVLPHLLSGVKTLAKKAWAKLRARMERKHPKWFKHGKALVEKGLELGKKAAEAVADAPAGDTSSLAGLVKSKIDDLKEQYPEAYKLGVQAKDMITASPPAAPVPATSAVSTPSSFTPPAGFGLSGRGAESERRYAFGANTADVYRRRGYKFLNAMVMAKKI